MSDASATRPSGRRGSGNRPVSPRTERAIGYRAAIRHPVAARLLFAQLISEAGDFIGLAALVLLSYSSSRSALGPALVFASRSLPALAMAGLLGRWLDRPPRRVALIAAHLGGAVAIGICALAPNTGTAILSSALLGATRAAFRSIQAAVIAESVPADFRLPLFGAAAVINQVDQAVGILTGAAVTLTIGVRTSLLIDLASFLVAAAVLVGVPPAPRIDRPEQPGPLEGVRIVARHPVLRWLSVLVLASTFSSSLPEALAPAFVDRQWLPAALAASSAGGAIFTFGIARTSILRRVVNQVWVTVLLAVALWLTGIAVLLHAPDWVYVLGNAAVGAGLGWLIGAQATVAALTRPERMSQVEATLVAGLITSGGAGVLLLGLLANAVSPAAAYLAGGVLLTVAVLVSAPRLGTVEAAGR